MVTGIERDGQLVKFKSLATVVSNSVVVECPFVSIAYKFSQSEQTRPVMILIIIILINKPFIVHSDCGTCRGAVRGMGLIKRMKHVRTDGAATVLPVAARKSVQVIPCGATDGTVEGVGGEEHGFHVGTPSDIPFGNVGVVCVCIAKHFFEFRHL